MSRIRGHKELDPSRPLYVKREHAEGGYRYGERRFAKGDAFPWKDLGVGARKLRQLHDQRWIGHEKPGERTGAESARPAPPIPAPRKQPQQPRR